MDKDKLIQTTLKIYKKTLLFPKKEPLRYKLREIADDILANYITWDIIKNLNINKDREQAVFNLEKNLDIIQSYFEIAKWQNWVSYFNILEIQEEYAMIGEQIKQELKQIEEKRKVLMAFEPAFAKATESKKVVEGKEEIDENTIKKAVTKKKNILDERKQKILEILKDKEKMQVWEANEVFPKVSKRTIRRDFVELLRQGLIERIGERNSTFYQLKRLES